MPLLTEYLKHNPYPGRGILLGLSPDSKWAIAAYFIMGRSESSRNRLIVESSGGLSIVPFHNANVENQSLIFYRPLHMLGSHIIIANGDHGDSIFSHMAKGGSFQEGLLPCTYEPDPPHYTPRISGLLTIESGACGYALSTLFKSPNNAECVRVFHHYPLPKPGTLHILHTYAACDQDGRLLPFIEAPPCFSIENSWADIGAFTETLWQSLHEENRVSLFVRYWPLKGGAPLTTLINKHQYQTLPK